MAAFKIRAPRVLPFDVDVVHFLERFLPDLYLHPVAEVFIDVGSFVCDFLFPTCLVAMNRC